jgi:hypothetical protein
VIVESSNEDHGLIVFNSTVDSRWNDLPLKPSFLPLFHEIIRYLTRYNESRGWYSLGEAIPVTAGLENVRCCGDRSKEGTPRARHAHGRTVEVFHA